MIPKLQFGRQSKTPEGKPIFIKTQADDELAHCQGLRFRYANVDVPVWKYLEAYCPIRGVDGGKIPFEMNGGQIAIYKEIDRQMSERGFARLNVGKGRQMGSSTLIEGLFWSNMVTTPGYQVGILADTEEKGRGLLDKYRFFYLNTPEPFRSVLRKAEKDNSANKLSFDFGGGMISSVEVIVANENAGASKTFQGLHESEVALWKTIGPTILALEQTVASAPGTIIVRETTARGPNQWKDYFEIGKAKKTPWRSLFLAWYLDRRYRSEYDGHQLNAYERRLRSAGVPMDAIQWWSEKWHEVGDNMAYMKQEFPSFESEMWETTAVSIFDPQIVAEGKRRAADEERVSGYFDYDDPITDGSVDGSVELPNPSFMESQYGSVSIYRQPEAGHPYAVVCDPAEGGSDYYAVHVMDASNSEQMAVYHAKGVSAKEAAFQCFLLGEMYRTGTDPDNPMDNRVRHSGERNTTTEYLRWIARLGGDVVTDRQDDERGGYVNYLGYRTTQANRRPMIDKARTYLEETKGTLIHDYETFVEMETFQFRASGILGKEKPQAVGAKAHDDLVMALCGYFHCLDRGDFDTDVIPQRKPGSKYRFDPFARSDAIAEEHFQNW